MSPATPSATDVVAVPAETTEPTEPSAPVAPVTSSTTLSASAAAPAGVVVPKPEYPRPDRDRSAAWLTLNGPWDFESEYGTTTITVPFAWETEASGVQRTWLERGTYRRSVTVPAEWDGSRVLLCFGAVHHRARVLVDDVEVGVHVGGYTSFEARRDGACGARGAGGADRRGRGARRQAVDPARQAAVGPARRLRRRLVHADVRHLAERVARGARSVVRGRFSRCAATR